MKEAISYYYNINIDRIIKKENYYLFNYLNFHYLLLSSDIPINDNYLEEINNKINRDNLIIIRNKYYKTITTINNSFYILFIIKYNLQRNTNIKDITLVNKMINNNYKESPQWNILWSKKIDYLEYQINQIGHKYPLLVNSFSYYVGLTENAISYYQNTINDLKKEPSDIKVLCHKRISNDLFSIYNPLNIIIDHQARDLAEYIKLSFFNNNQNIYQELKEYFHYNYYSLYAVRILLSRILYPSYYFDIYDEIIIKKRKEEDILKIISKIDEFELYLRNIFNFFKKYYPIPELEWLKYNY